MIEPNELPQLLSEQRVDSLLITNPENVRYLSGFTTPSDGRIFVSGDGAWLITDARYDAQAAEESRLPVELRRDWLPWVASRSGSGRLGIEADSLTYAAFCDLEVETAGTLVPLRDLLRERRMIKSDHEIALLRRASALTDQAFAHILDLLVPGISEVEVALELERFMLSHGAEGKSFDTVVASGERSAMPHGVASGRKLGAGELVVIDFGANVSGYHADMTRTVAIGELPQGLPQIYDAVLEAQLAALAAAGPGVPGKELDAVARQALGRHGLDEAFVHSLGHGVGLHIHEDPKLSRTSEDVLAPGMTVTIEPGVYLPGRGGVRIEDLVLITTDGIDRLSTSPKELITL